MAYHAVCEKCQLPIPSIAKGQIDPWGVPCSIYHIRCIRCGWPVAKNLIEKDEELCISCKTSNNRKEKV